MNDVERLTKAFEIAEDKAHKADRAYSDRKRELLSKAEEVIYSSEEIVALRSERDSLYENMARLERELGEARVKAATVNGVEGWPLGTKICRQKPDFWGRPTGKLDYAVVEVVTADSEFSKTLARHSRPEIGDIVARFLKVDGSRSLRVERLNNKWVIGLWKKVD